MLDLDILLVPYKSFGGDWKAFNEAIYEYFCEDFIVDCPVYGKKEVWLSDHCKDDGKEGTFWHITTNKQDKSSVGSNTDRRIPDIKRSERIRWIKEIIENSLDSDVKIWVETIKGNIRHHLMYKDVFLVVLGESRNNKKYILVTSYWITEKNRGGYLKRYEDHKKKG